MADGYLIAGFVLAFAMAFAVGSNDAANSLATSYGSNALKKPILISIGACFEFIGAYWCSGHVAAKLVDDVIEDRTDLNNEEDEQIMIAVGMASFIFVIASSVFGMPVSGTHAVVGALVGAGLASVGADDVNWEKLGIICASWVVAPVCAIILSSIFFISVCKTTQSPDKWQFAARLLWMCLFIAVAFALITYMIIALVKDKGEKMNTWELSLLCASPVIGVLIVRIALIFCVRPKNLGCCKAFCAVMKLWSCEDYVTFHKERILEEDDEQLETANKTPENEVEKEQNVIMQVYRVCMLSAEFLVALGHGANDVANCICPLLIILEIHDKEIKWAYLTGGLGIAVGMLMLGWRTMETVGKKIIKLDYVKGFTAQFSTALTVNFGTVIGMPLSTTHCICGSIFGLVVSNKLSKTA